MRTDSGDLNLSAGGEQKMTIQAVGSGSCTWAGFQGTGTATAYRCCIK
jgi:hypothetical protein